MSQPIDQDVFTGFAGEARSYLLSICGNLEKLKTAPRDPDALSDIHRCLHSIKGAAAMLGLGGLSGAAAELEQAVELIADGGMACDAEVIEGIGQAVEALGIQLDAVVPTPEPADNVPPDLLDIFRAEAGDLLRTIGEELQKLPTSANPRPILAEVRRTVHTLKGAAGSVGLADLSKVAHRMEDLLDANREGRLAFTPPVNSLLTSTLDQLLDMAAGPADGAALEALYARYEQMLEGAGAEETAPPMVQEVAPAAASEAPGGYVRVPIERLDHMVRLVGELVVSRSTFEQSLKAYAVGVEELQHALRRLERIAAQMEGSREALAVPFAANGAHEFDPLELDRYTPLELLKRDLHETVSDIDTAAGDFALRGGDFDNYLVRHRRLTSEIHDRFMHLRMTPLSNLSMRLRRAFRVAAEHGGKLADLVIEGEDVELDKSVVEGLAGPLEHLLRNAVDHGIEDEATRLAESKSARGKVTLRARYEGTHAVIQVSDDGAGLRTEAVAEAAVRAGICSAEEAAGLSPAELQELIYHQGISTATEVTAISGRGVGMDAVREAVVRLKGTIHVESAPGQGTIFTIRLPLTLAIMRALMVKSNSETFAVPMAVITKVTRVAPDLFERIGRQLVMRDDGVVLPAVHLGEALRLKNPPDHTVKAAPALVIEVEGQKMALVVDEILEARDVVVKKLGGLLGDVRAVTGATTTGDGAVALIVDPNDLVDVPEGAEAVTRPAARDGLDVLIVDDSVSVRHVLTSFIRKSGFRPVTAKDGVEALEVLEHAAKPPDVVLLDVEMPRMDGFELTAALRSSPEFRDLPIVMLTSRSGDKHRQKALGLGATEYLVKPYTDDVLLSTIHRVVNGARNGGGKNADVALR